MLTPMAKKYMAKEAEKLRLGVVKDIKEKRKNPVYQLPAHPMKEDTILRKMEDGAKYP